MGRGPGSERARRTETYVMAKNALVYVSDIILGRTGEILARDEQLKRVMAYARSNGINVLDVFEDDAYNEDILSRPGMTKLLACKLGCDCILVDRVWSLSRNMKTLRTFFAELESRNVKLEAATTLWDCASQMSRHYFAGRKPAGAERPDGSKIRRPAHLHFLGVDRGESIER